jgi:hypothetical protein
VSGILDHVEDKPLLECLGDPPMTATALRRQISLALEDLFETLSADQVEEVAAAFRGAGLL